MNSCEIVRVYFHVGSDTMSRNQFNQKLKLIVKAPGYVIYFNRDKWK